MNTALPPEIALPVLAALVAASAFFSGSETALFSLQPEMLARLRQAGVATRIDRLLERPRRTLAAILMGNELVNISISTLCAGLVLRALQLPAWVNLLVATPLLILLGEVLPKTVALRWPDRWARVVALPLAAWALVTTPIRFVLVRVAELLTRPLGVRGPPDPIALDEDDVRHLIQEGRRAGTIGEVEEDLIEKVFEFADIPVSRLMTPRPDIVSIPLTIEFEELREVVRLHRYSRLPVHRTGVDDIFGILLVKDLVRFPGGEGYSVRALKQLVKRAYFVPTTKSAEDMLREFRLRRSHMAIVVDEHGSVAGLVTLDDILRELVGELADEDDAGEVAVERVREDTFTVPGHMDLDAFAESTGIALPEGGYSTVAGFVLAQLGHLPQKGEVLRWNGLRFEVTGLEGHRIVEIAVQREAKAAEEAV